MGEAASRAADAAGRLPLVPSDSDDVALAAVFDVFRTAGGRCRRSTGRSATRRRCCRAGSTSPGRCATTLARHGALRELIIIRVAQLTGTAYEWLAHYDMAVVQGVPEATLEELTSWRTNADLDDVEREVLAMTDELTVDLEVGDATWAALAERYEPGELVELVLTAAFYSCVSRVLRTLRLPVDPTDPRLGSLGGFSGGRAGGSAG